MTRPIERVEAGPADPFPRPRLDTERPLLIASGRYLGYIALWFLPATAYFLARKANAISRLRSSGECWNCRINLTWPLRDPRPWFCPSCGAAEPCPEPPPGSGGD